MKNIKYLVVLFICLLSMGFFCIKAEAATKVNISVSSNSTVNVNDTFNATIKVSSTDKISKYQYTLNYDTSKVKLLSGATNILWDGVGSKSLSKTFKFKALNKGNTLITVKNYSAAYEDMTNVKDSNIAVSGKNINIKTGNDSNTDNYLESLSVKEGTLDPKFSKTTLKYKLTLDKEVKKINIKATALSSKATITGDGEVDLEEGLNDLKVIVKAGNGEKRIYSIEVEIKEKNPIILSINGNKYTVIKNKNTVKEMCPVGYDLKTLEMKNEEVPTCYSDTTRLTLIGLKNDSNKTYLFIYNQNKNTYKYYNEIKVSETSYLPLIPEKKMIPDDYKKVTITINDKKVTAYKNKQDDKYYLIYAMNLNNGKKSWYKYEPTEKTFQKYYSLDMEDEDNLIIIILGAILLISLTGNVIALSKKSKKRVILKK